MVGTMCYVNPFDKTPNIGDVLLFKCFDDYKCFGRPTIAHRLVEVRDDGCMVIVGDNPKYDWSTEPCFMPNEIEIIGTEHPLPF